MTAPDLDALTRLVAAMTPGEWKPHTWYGTDDGGWAAVGPHHPSEDDDDDAPGGGSNCEAKAAKDADGIAALRNAAEWLLSRARDAERYEIIVRDIDRWPCLSACDGRMPRDNNPATACLRCRARAALKGETL